MKSSMSALALAAACMTGTTAWAALPPGDDAALEQRFAARFAGDRTGACVLAAVIDHDKVVRARSCAGTRDDGPPAMDAALEIGSVTKTMTAYLVADLVERGLWSLDDPIARHLPAGTIVPRQGDRQILVRDLLTHSAGLPPLPPGMQSPDPSDPYASLTEAELLKSLAQVQLSRPIGSQSEYSNFGMMLVSLAVARSDGGSYEAALRERLFKPLGMTSYVTVSASERPAQGHLPTGRPTKPWTLTPNLAGVGMVRASLADMERYARAGLGDGPADVVARMLKTEQPLANGYGMNWARQSIEGHTVLMHEGGTGGFSSFIALDLAAHRAVVLLADTALTDLGGLGDLGLALLGLDVPVQAPRKSESASPAARHALVGDYRLGALPLHIWEEDGRLLAQAAGQDSFELQHDSRGDFYPTAFSALLTPLPDAKQDGLVQRFAWRQGGGVVEAVRVGSTADTKPTITNLAWRDWAGEFQLAGNFALRVFEQDGRLMVQGTGQPAIEAEPVGPDRIAIRSVGAVVEFERGADGQVVAAVLRQNGQVLRGVRR
jgi:CubicO group peptidase (beta-lactamase class C family)